MDNTTEMLIKNIEAKDRRFRVAQVIFLAVIITSILALLFLGYQQQLANQKLIASQEIALNKLTNGAKQRTEQINDLEQHIDCIVLLFQSKNRANLVISDVESCKIDTVTGNVVYSAKPVAPPQASRTTTPTATPISVPSPAPSPKPTTTQQPAVTKSKNILGICLPLILTCSN